MIGDTYVCLSDEDDEPCNSVVLCEGDEAYGGDADPLDNPESFLKDTDWHPEDSFAVDTDSDTDTAYPDDPPCGTMVNGEYRCGDAGHNHRWCQVFNEDPSLPEQSPADGRHGKSGEKLVSFNFDPSFNLNYKLKPGLMGLAEFELGANASFIAQVKFNIGKARGTLDLLDVFGGASADICGTGVDVAVQVMGFDFTDVLLGDEVSKASYLEPEERQKCRDAVDNFTAVVDQAKKAMKDAQELIRQYEAAAKNGAVFNEYFCAQVAHADKTPADFPLINCEAGLSPEEVIGHFIAYYETKLSDVFQWKNKLDKLLSVLNEKLNKKISLPNEPKKYNEDIIAVQFAIGPIPCVLEVAAWSSPVLVDRSVMLPSQRCCKAFHTQPG